MSESDFHPTIDLCKCGALKFKRYDKCTKCRGVLRNIPFAEGQDQIDPEQDAMERMEALNYDRDMDRAAEKDTWWVVGFFIGAAVLMLAIVAAVSRFIWIWIFTF